MEKRFIWAYLLIGALCFAIVYVFQSVALFIIARRENCAHRWMAFVPILNTYYIGVVSQKNKIFNKNPKYFAIAAACVEFVYAVLSILVYVSEYLLFSGGYPEPIYELFTYGNSQLNVLTGYDLSAVPQRLQWAANVFTVIPDYVLSWMGLVSLVLNVFVLMSFFQTYACRHYVLFTLFSVIFPIKGIFMFAVKGNKGMNYREYIQEQQRKRYQAYQEYMSKNGQGGYNYNPYQGGENGGNPYQGSAYGTPKTEDPFEGMGDSEKQPPKDGDGGGSDDPFEGF